LSGGRARQRGGLRPEILLIIAGSVFLIVGILLFLVQGSKPAEQPDKLASPAPVATTGPEAAVPSHSPDSSVPVATAVSEPAARPAATAAKPTAAALPPSPEPQAKVQRLWQEAEDAFRAQNYDRAIDRYRQVLTAQPTYPEAKARLAEAEEAASRRKQATEQLAAARALAAKKQYQEAAAAAATVLESDPDNADAKKLKAQWDNEVIKESSARAAASAALDQIIADGRSALQRGQLEQAKSAADAARESAPDNPEVQALNAAVGDGFAQRGKLLSDAEALAKTGNVAAAFDKTTDLLTKYPGFQPAVDLRARLERDVAQTDSIPPAILEVVPESAIEGKDLKITATIADDKEMGSVRVFYRVDPNGPFRELQMKTSRETLYTAAIPGDAVQRPAVLLKIEARDKAGNKAVYPEEGETITVDVQKKVRPRIKGL